MKPIIRILFRLVFFSVLFTSCGVSYLVNYQTFLEGESKEPLQYVDSIIKIRFDPKPNGIYFDIENLTKSNLYLIWDKSYFISPSGNSSKALNTDLLETKSVIRDKENYESIIPQGAHFMRFTCAATNLSLFSKLNSVTLYSEAAKTIRTNIEYTEFYSTGNYWYLGSRKSYGSDKELPNLDIKENSYVQNFIKNNNKLGLGFTIRNDKKDIEYHFKFPIKKVIVSKKTANDFEYIQAYELDMDNRFNAIKIERKQNILPIIQK